MRTATDSTDQRDTAFRDSPSVIASEADKLAVSLQGAMANRPHSWGNIFVQRQSRIAFGKAGSLAAALIVLAFLTVPSISVFLLVASWPFAYLVSKVAGRVATAYLRRYVASIGGTNDDPYTRLTQLQKTSPATIEYELSRRDERASLAWPLIAVALLAPMTFAMLGFGVLFTNTFGFMFGQDLEAAAELMAYLACATAASHVVFAASMLKYATQRNAKSGILLAATAAVASTMLFLLFWSPAGNFSAGWLGKLFASVAISMLVAAIVALIGWLVSVTGLQRITRSFDREMAQLHNYSE